VNAQDRALRDAFGTHRGGQQFIDAVFAPNDYRVSRGGTEYSATTFGVRDTATSNWTFYAQRYTLERSGPPKVFGLKEVKSLF
jgi:hypothetical protein